MTSRVEQFEHVAATELPLLADEFELDDAERESLDAWVLGMREWMAGALDWSRRTARYDEATARELPLVGSLVHAGPAGFGLALSGFATAGSRGEAR
jgi:germacradienol/geosmin synthase